MHRMEIKEEIEKIIFHGLYANPIAKANERGRTNSLKGHSVIHGLREEISFPLWPVPPTNNNHMKILSLYFPSFHRSYLFLVSMNVLLLRRMDRCTPQRGPYDVNYLA